VRVESASVLPGGSVIGAQLDRLVDRVHRVVPAAPDADGGTDSGAGTGDDAYTINYGNEAADDVAHHHRRAIFLRHRRRHL
jgi:hypothetical protein